MGDAKMLATVNLVSGFDVQRQNMVLGQIQPFGVINESILQAFGTVPREQFVPTNCQNIAYVEGALHTKLLAPAVHAKWLQAANIKMADKILLLDDNSGYGLAILKMLAKNVATQQLDKTKYDVVVCHAAVNKPEDLKPYLALLKEGGRLLAFCNNQAIIYERFGANTAMRVLFDAFVPCTKPSPTDFIF
jgi:protein-L-isoaspartate(D-aspartate) O-methyltransferase